MNDERIRWNARTEQIFDNDDNSIIYLIVLFSWSQKQERIIVITQGLFHIIWEGMLMISPSHNYQYIVSQLRQ